MQEKEVKKDFAETLRAGGRISEADFLLYRELQKIAKERVAQAVRACEVPPDKQVHLDNLLRLTDPDGKFVDELAYLRGFLDAMDRIRLINSLRDDE
jgi:hypothetical protein